jgi:hypothetical protein
MGTKYHSGLVVVAVALAACSSKKEEAPPVATVLPAGISATDEGAVFRTDEYTLDPGQERFLCFAANAEKDLVIESVSHAARSGLHHIIFSKANAPEPDGFSECDTLFRLTWEPIYLTGAGDSSLDLPAGFAHRIPVGTQMVAQLHLLNTTEEPIRDSVEIRLRKSRAEAPKPVAGYAFGNFDVHLPPLQPSSVHGECDVKEDIHILAAFPHMHLLGKRLTFDVARAGGEFSQVFERNPYDFDDQHMETLDLALSVGDRTRVNCEYENTHDYEITFGESTTNEMCFLVGFAADREKIGGCISRPAAAPAAPATVEPVPAPAP